MEQITTVGIDLAKNVFSLHGVDRSGAVVLKRTLGREQRYCARGYLRAKASDDLHARAEKGAQGVKSPLDL